jgi:HD-like signal output (HDOD) protein
MRGDEDREFNITRTILSDPALTQKVLRLANSPMYAVFGQQINTVTKAVAVLGTESIGHLALGQKLIDGLSVASPDSLAARAEMEKSVLSGHIGRQIAGLASSQDAEAATVCAMLHGLGRVMVAFYLPEHWQALQSRCTTHGETETSAAVGILGLGLDQLGRGVAQLWSLPGSLVDTLADVAPATLGEPLEHQDWLAAVATLSLRCAEVAYHDSAQSVAALEPLILAYAPMIGIEPAALVEAVQRARRTVQEGNAPASPSKQPGSLHVRQMAAGKSGATPDAAASLARGIAEMREAEPSASTAQLMSMGLEVLFGSLGCSHGAVFQRFQAMRQNVPNPISAAPQDARPAGHYRARMCLGEGLQPRAAAMTFDDAYRPDVFHAALATEKMIFIDNTRDASFANRLPQWWKSALPGVIGLLIIPLTVHRQPVGFLYGDWLGVEAPARIDAAGIAALNDLRTMLCSVLERQRLLHADWYRGLG